MLQAADGLGQGIVVAVALAANRRFDTGLGKTLTVADRDALQIPIAVMNIHSATLSELYCSRYSNTMRTERSSRVGASAIPKAIHTVGDQRLF